MAAKIVQHADADSGPHGFELPHRAGAAEDAARVAGEDRRVVEGGGVGVVVDADDGGVPGEIGLVLRRAHPLEVAPRGVEAEAVVGELRQDQSPMRRPIQADREIRLAPGQGERPRQRDQFDHEIRVPAGEEAELAGQEQGAEPVRRADPHRSARLRLPLPQPGCDREHLRLDPLRHGDEVFAGLGQRRAVRPSVEQGGPRARLPAP